MGPYTQEPVTVGSYTVEPETVEFFTMEPETVESTTSGARYSGILHQWSQIQWGPTPMEPDTVGSNTVVPGSSLHVPVVPDTMVPCTDGLYKLSVFLKKKKLNKTQIIQL